MKERPINTASHIDPHFVNNYLQIEIGLWGDETFGQSTPESVIAHFKKEAKEFIDSGDPVEAADCVMLLMHHGHKCGYSLLDEVSKKFQINKKRKWGTPDADGVVEHIRDEQ